MLTTAEHLKRLPFKGYHAQYPFQYVWNFDVGGPDPIVDYPGVFWVEQAANGGYYYDLDGALVLNNFDTVNNFFIAYPAATFNYSLIALGYFYRQWTTHSCIEVVLEALVSPAITLWDGYNYRLTIPESYFNASGTWLSGKNHIVYQQGQLWVNGTLDTGLATVHVGVTPCQINIWRNSYELTRKTKIWAIGFYNDARPDNYSAYGHPVWLPDPAYSSTSGYRYAFGSPTIPVPNPLRLELTP